MTKEKKVWGTAQHFPCSHACGVSVLEVEQGGYCSWHYHNERVNRFIVHSGRIVVEVKTPSGGRNEFELAAGGWHDVQPRDLHRFRVLEPGVVVEVYFAPAISMSDIVRMDTGGMELGKAA